MHRKSAHADPHKRNATLHNAWRLYGQFRPKEAEAACRAILDAYPDHAQALHLLALLSHDGGRSDRSVRLFKKAIAIDPENPAHHKNLAVVLSTLDRLSEAAGHLCRALSLHPEDPEATGNLGTVSYRLHRYREAERCFQAVLRARPDSTEARAGLGMVMLAQGKFAEAAEHYAYAIAADPSRADWHNNLGAAYMRMSRFDEAAECFRRASGSAPDHPDYTVNLGIALRACGKLDESVDVLESAIAGDPANSHALAHLVVGLEYTCRWHRLESAYPLLERMTEDALRAGRVPDEDPMQCIRRCDDLALILAVGRARSLATLDRVKRLGAESTHSRSASRIRRITVGYLSNDFRNHPVIHQLFPLFGMHDRTRFRIVGFSTGPDDGSTFRRKVIDGCDRFVEIGAMDTVSACNAIRAEKVDILVDLMGHSHHNRMDILALRPAAVQIGYLGFLATTGAGYIDYLVADRIVVPESHEPFYSEKLIRMPACYQMNHSESMEPGHARRGDWGLPPSGPVLCCFNASYKIDRRLFDAWMRILHRVPDAVLWLNGTCLSAVRNMRSRAALLGIDPPAARPRRGRRPDGRRPLRSMPGIGISNGLAAISGRTGTRSHRYCVSVMVSFDA
jgi:predicted O-linked N-acetylglucosamine transferase (SPINDLY family)